MDEITHVEIHNIAPLGPAETIVIRSGTEARAFEFRSYERSDDDMTELWTLGPEVELKGRRPIKSVFKDGAQPSIIGTVRDSEDAGQPLTLKPGETLIIRVSDLTPNQVQYYQESLDAAIEHRGLDLRALIVYGDELAVQQREASEAER